MTGKYDNTSKMPWGKHKGLMIRFIPTTYLSWIVNNVESDDELIEACSSEISRRNYENDHVWEK